MYLVKRYSYCNSTWYSYNQLGARRGHTHNTRTHISRGQRVTQTQGASHNVTPFGLILSHCLSVITPSQHTAAHTESKSPPPHRDHAHITPPACRMGKNKRKTPMSERGVVLLWKRDERGSKGFGFIERATGDRVFCHKSQITDGNALREGSEVSFDVRADHRPGAKDGEVCASNVRGGVCFSFAYLKRCELGKSCRFSHAERFVVRAPGSAAGASTKTAPTLEEALAAVIAGRAPHATPILVDTVAACREQCERLCQSWHCRC